MLPQKPSEQLKEIRAKLGITTRDVAVLSQRLAETENNPEYAISNAWLTQVENSTSVPSIYKLYALSAVYRIKFTDLLRLFGVDLEKLGQHQKALQLPNTHLVTMEVYDSERTVSFPIRFDRSFDIDNTNLLNRLVEIWGEVPISLIQHLDLRHSLYGYVGLQDYTLYPLLRPGSFVQLDQRVRKIRPARWRTEHDRPIYFVELRDGYACSWCEIQDNYLLLLPHPLSPASVRRLSYGTEAEIVGQVTAVAMRLADDPAAQADDAARLPKRSLHSKQTTPQSLHPRATESQPGRAPASATYSETPSALLAMNSCICEVPQSGAATTTTTQPERPPNARTRARKLMLQRRNGLPNPHADTRPNCSPGSTRCRSIAPTPKECALDCAHENHDTHPKRRLAALGSSLFYPYSTIEFISIGRKRL